MSATQALPSDPGESPARAVLEHFLVDALMTGGGPSSENPLEKLAEADLRTDILYVLTDKIAHRRALPLTLLVEEVQKLQIPELMHSPASADRINSSLRVMVHQRLVREFQSPADSQYELAHDFLVRSVVRSYRELDRRRISELAVLRQRREVADAEFTRLSAMGRRISFLLRSVPVVTFLLSVYLIYLGIQGSLPSGVGLSYLWLLACPSVAMLLAGAAAHRQSATLLASLILLFCGGAWLYERSFDAVDIVILALFAFVLSVAHILFYPAIVLGTLAAESWAASALRRIWSEVFDAVLVLFVAVIGASSGMYARRVSGANSSSARIGMILGLCIAFSLVNLVFVILLRRIGATPGALLAKITTSDASGGTISLDRLLLRQVVFALWSALNLFFGIPSLVITPLYLWLRRDHQLFYDTWFNLKTDPVKPGDKTR
jgi:uncharacterized RDD family membrane protein YckC